VQLAESLGHPFSHAAALSYLTMLHQLRRDRRAVEEMAETTYRVCVENDFPYYLAWTTFLQGWVLTEQDAVSQGIELMERGLADLQAMRTGLRRPYYLGLLAEAYGKSGRIEDGLRLLADGIAQAREQGQGLYEPELHRMRGEMLTQGEAYEQAETCYRRALNLSRRQKAKLSELRAAASLARLLKSQGKRMEAHGELARIVDWFTEGLDTSDLVEARALLDELA